MIKELKKYCPNFIKKLIIHFIKLPFYLFRLLTSERSIVSKVSIFFFRNIPLIPYKWLLIIKHKKYPAYHYSVYHASLLAKSLGYKEISVIEFGCAKGKGLLELESITTKIEKLIGIKIQIYGFDTGEGLPKPQDFRDLSYHWQKGDFKMDKKTLKLKKANLLLGNIDNTKKDFFNNFNVAPIGAVFFDFDYYSSTKSGMDLLLSEETYYLPRVYTYFDDIIGNERELYNDFTGERLAIKEFNEEQATLKFSVAYHLICKKIIESWYHQIFILHRFKHPLYDKHLDHKSS